MPRGVYKRTEKQLTQEAQVELGFESSVLVKDFESNL